MNDVEIRFLRTDEAHILTDLVTGAYGTSYDADWVYDPDEIARRIDAGSLISTIGLLPDGTVAGHMALMREEPQAQPPWVHPAEESPYRPQSAPPHPDASAHGGS